MNFNAYFMFFNSQRIAFQAIICLVMVLSPSLSLAQESKITRITSQGYVSWSEKKFFKDQLYVDGGIGSGTWSLSNGTLPEGLSLSSDGLISGVPTQGGIYQFVVKFTDTTGQEFYKGTLKNSEF